MSTKPVESVVEALMSCLPSVDAYLVSGGAGAPPNLVTLLFVAFVYKLQ